MQIITFTPRSAPTSAPRVGALLPDGTHVLNFAARPPAHPMSLWVARTAKSATFRDLFGRVEKLTVTPKADGPEVSLPSFASYAAVEFGE